MRIKSGDATRSGRKTPAKDGAYGVASNRAFFDQDLYYIRLFIEDSHLEREMSCIRRMLASHPDILLARHAIFPPVGEERLRDEPKECLRGRLVVCRKLV